MFEVQVILNKFNLWPKFSLIQPSSLTQNTNFNSSVPPASAPGPASHLGDGAAPLMGGNGPSPSGEGHPHKPISP